MKQDGARQLAARRRQSGAAGDARDLRVIRALVRAGNDRHRVRRRRRARLRASDARLGGDRCGRGQGSRRRGARARPRRDAAVDPHRRGRRLRSTGERRSSGRCGRSRSARPRRTGRATERSARAAWRRRCARRWTSCAAPSGRAIITELRRGREAVRGEAGTTITATAENGVNIHEYQAKDILPPRRRADSAG